MSIKNNFSNNIKNITKYLEKLEKNYEQEMKKKDKNHNQEMKNLEKNILTKISEKFSISIINLENCLSNNGEINEEKINIIDSEISIEDEGQVLEEVKINNKKYYLDNSKKYIYKKNGCKMDHIGYLKDDEIILN